MTAYLPSSSERKRVVMSYLLVGVLFFSQQEDLSIFEYFHYKQSVGWLSFFITSLLLWIVTFVFFSIFRLGFISWIFAIPLFSAIILRWFLIFQGWRGDYLTETTTDKRWKLFFVDFGGWVLGIFGITKNIYGDIELDTVADIAKIQSDIPSDM